jgi:hypothetical protein
MLRIRSVVLAACGGDSYRNPDGALAAGSLAEGAGKFGTAKVQLLRGDGVPCFNNELAALNGNEVTNRGKVWRHLAQQVAKGSHGSRESQLLFETERSCRLREQAA